MKATRERKSFLRHTCFSVRITNIYIYISKYIVTYVVNAAAARLPLAKPSFQLRIEAIIIEYKHIYIYIVTYLVNAAACG